MNIGDKLRYFRKEKKMTLQELSEKSGVAVATLSRMETGKMTGTLESHAQIAKALDVNLTELYKDLERSQSPIHLQKSELPADIFTYEKGSSIRMLVSKVLEKKMMPQLVAIEPYGKTHKEQTKPGSEKFVYVLSGNVEIFVGDEKYSLKNGDSLYFDSSIIHYIVNPAAKESECLVVISPPAL